MKETRCFNFFPYLHGLRLGDPEDYECDEPDRDTESAPIVRGCTSNEPLVLVVSGRRD